MSTLRTDNLTASNGVGGSIPMSFAVQGTAKCWSNLNGTGTIAPRDDFNVSSYVDSGVGSYVINFSTARPNANYNWQVSSRVMATWAGNGNGASSALATSASVFHIENAAFTDTDIFCASIFGDPH